MARLKSELKITGRLGELSFFETADGIIVRRGWGPDKKRMRKDPAFERTRENGKEFGACARASSLLRSVFRRFIKDASDNRVTSRVNKLMFELKNLDTLSKRGERNVAQGIKSTKAEKLMKGFDFNNEAPIKMALKKEVIADTAKSNVYLKGFTPKNDLVFPKGATHVNLRAGLARIDFEKKTFQLKETEVVTLSKKNGKQDVELIVETKPTGKGKDIFVLRLDFMQELNKEFYPLKNKGYNVSAIVGVGE